MKYFLTLLVSLFLVYAAHSQNLEFKERVVGTETTIVCINPTSKTFEVTLNYSAIGYKVDKPSPVRQQVAANSETIIITYSQIKGQSASMQLNYTYRELRGASIPSDVVLENIDGITVFGKNHCGRCSSFISGLKRNGVEFKEYNVDDSDTADALMWQKLADAGFTSGSIMMPVVIVDDKVLYNIENLSGLLSQLSKN